jgi:hypothetical protein
MRTGQRFPRSSQERGFFLHYKAFEEVWGVLGFRGGQRAWGRRDFNELEKAVCLPG